jgi:hypothetical protein
MKYRENTLTACSLISVAIIGFLVEMNAKANKV